MFAALTGVAFKEGMCYGKAECAALFFVVPATLLGHLTGVGSGAFSLHWFPYDRVGVMNADP
jgi:uncharacterized integral membrane protein